ncbi:MAG: hypothetical protein KF822_09210 [Steroidobacteraceae bacterium]|nr:hypothetical protein [Steroidobacteraceae bacterium]
MRSREAPSDPGVHVWIGASGRKYRYAVYMVGTVFGPGPANFVFARETRPGLYAAVHIGHTGDLSEPFDNHLAMQCIRLNRATHIHVKLSTAPEEVRRAECSDLIAEWSPPCNSMR